MHLTPIRSTGGGNAAIFAARRRSISKAFCLKIEKQYNYILYNNAGGKVASSITCTRLRIKQSLTLLIFNLSSLLVIELQWLPARKRARVAKKTCKKLSLAQLTIENRHNPSGLPLCVFRDGSVDYFSNFFLLNLGKS